MIKRRIPGLPGGLPGGLPDIDVTRGGLTGIDASIFPTFQVRSRMPDLPVKAPTQAKSSGSNTASGGSTQSSPSKHSSPSEKK